MAQTLNAKTTFVGKTAELRQRSAAPAAARVPIVVRAQQEETVASRRAALGLLAGAAALVSGSSPSYAGYGDAANVFGRVTNKSGFVPYAGEGYALLLPSKWNPSKEREFPGVDLRYEDNGDAVNNLSVIVKPTSNKSIEDFGSPDKFLQENAYLFGEDVWKGSTRSEGGFAPNKVSSGSILDVQQTKDKSGKAYYKFELLTRSADGDEGGRHHLVTASVGNGNLYMLKVQIGDKRWFKGAKKDAEGAWNSFTVA
jgi:hypothetical protein